MTINPLVSLVKSPDSYQGVLSSLLPLKNSIKSKISKLEYIVVKINFVTTKKELATTPVLAVKAFVDFIRPFYKGKIIIAEEATFGNTDRGFETYGFSQIAAGDGNAEVINTKSTPTENVSINFAGGKIRLPLSQVYTKSPYTVSICRAKTHNEVVVTLSIKNLCVGAIRHGLFKNRFRIHLGGKINHIIAGLTQYIYPNLSIIDGTVGMEGEGPSDGTPVKSNWVISSLDPLAADSLATYLMGFDLGDVGYLTLIQKAGKGGVYPKIKIIGTDPEKVRHPYKKQASFAKQRMWN